MRCKQHSGEQGGSGVCATCLTERLLDLIDDRRKSDRSPAFVFPRSVSPYICRSSAGDTCHRQKLFYRTPQIGPTFSRKKTGSFSLISSLFGFGSKGSERDPRACKASSSSSSSWFSSLLSGRRKKKKGKENEGKGSPIGSDYSSETPTGRRKLTPDTRRGHTRSVSGISLYLSPLVRASPKEKNRPEVGFSGEIPSPNRRHFLAGGSVCANRSRKLADFGRYG
ncbi:uncharacterized protein LOC143886943 [Tasmannia lanceolata]|uniref:uncharacterized protein LOC143886943 n=1 Tax=Tasmannia lanceolata TaxID=3420 RepID=UPI004063E30A